MDAPMSIVRGIVAAANHQPAQAFGPLFKFKNLA